FCTIGQFLRGTYLPNSLGYHNLESIFDPNKLEYVWEEDCYKRLIPYAICNGKKVKINNLHIHSKQLKNFKS
ncbi:MAG: hypothetical protein WCG10_07215, partial [Chlamydiota bacterium]